MGGNTTAIGRSAEDTAVSYLLSGGYKILARNWKTRRCEIDIVASKGSTVHFIEVKYRSKPSQGKGLDYITPQKQRQMRFAAEIWVVRNRWQGMYTLSALGVDSTLKTIEFVEFI